MIKFILKIVLLINVSITHAQFKTDFDFFIWEMGTNDSIYQLKDIRSPLITNSKFKVLTIGRYFFDYLKIDKKEYKKTDFYDEDVEIKMVQRKDYLSIELKFDNGTSLLGNYQEIVKTLDSFFCNEFSRIKTFSTTGSPHEQHINVRQGKGLGKRNSIGYSWTSDDGTIIVIVQININSLPSNTNVKNKDWTIKDNVSLSLIYNRIQ